ncbi:MAG: formylglycine-generating enzyme family protein [Treponema sp.]|jgi:formylglycine-generating enzyme required for sulfatase activity|nr:formylglycine-generating enzyme family protein [Treponema sp.]
MNTSLLSIVKQITAQYGEEVLADPKRLKSFFSDLAKDESKPLRLAFGKCVESGYYRILKDTKTAQERREVIDSLARRLRDDEGLDIALCSGALEVLAAAIFGEEQIAPAPAVAVTPPAPAPAAAPLEHPIPANMALVEGGTFNMGSDCGESNEQPVHKVTVKGFYMGKYEVMQKEWAEVMGSSPSYFKGDDLPVENVSWMDAIEYCDKRSQKEGLKPCYQSGGGVITCDWSANGYRLPTEAEWEYAAKGGGRDIQEYEYSGGSNADTVAWYSGNTTHPVGTKAANSLGIYDLSGNVCEWCWDWYGAYSSGTQTDPTGAASGTYRVVRSGSWYYVARFVRSAVRDYFAPSFRNNNLGFRLVRSCVPQGLQGGGRT